MVNFSASEARPFSIDVAFLRVTTADDEFAGVAAASTRAPAPDEVRLSSPLRLASLRLSAADGTPYGGSALVPIGTGPLALLLVRVGGPEFHASELWRVGQVGQIVGHVLAPV